MINKFGSVQRIGKEEIEPHRHRDTEKRIQNHAHTKDESHEKMQHSERLTRHCATCPLTHDSFRVFVFRVFVILYSLLCVSVVQSLLYSCHSPVLGESPKISPR